MARSFVDQPAEHTRRPEGWVALSLPVLMSGMGLMADMYDLNIINIVRPLLEAEYGQMSPWQNSLITSASIGGCIVGMLVIGNLSDKIGRRSLFVATAVLISFAMLGSALAVPTPSLGMDVYTWLILWRFLMGIGLGGEYPLAAANTVENVGAANSTRSLLLVYAVAAIGDIGAPLVVLALSVGPTAHMAGGIWRLAFGFGAMMSLLCAGSRWALLKETQSFRRTAEAPRLVAGDAEDARTIRESGDRCHPLTALRHMPKSLIGTCGAWLIYDIVTYACGLYSTDIFPMDNSLGSAWTVLFINSISIPGLVVALIASPYVSLRDLQLVGFVGMMLCFVPLASNWYRTGQSGNLTLFSIMRCFDYLGPGVGTYVIPGQVFPTKVRGTAHGMAAATGKVGALIGTVLFPLLSEEFGLGWTLVMCAGLSMLGLMWTLLFVPSYGAKAIHSVAAVEQEGHMSDEQVAAFAERIFYSDAGTTDGEVALLRRANKCTEK